MNSTLRIFWQRHGLTAILILLSVVCLAAIGYETSWGRSLHTPAPVANNASRAGEIVATQPAFSMPPLEVAYKESGERPLFTPTRRPAALNLANVPTMKKGQFKLSGTSISNDLTVAYLIEVASGKTVRVTKGKEINGMTMDTVEANRVVLKQGEETEELVLRTAASPPVKAVPAPAPGGFPSAGTPPPLPGAPPVNNFAPPPQPAVANTVPTPQANAPTPGVLTPGSSQMPGFVMPQGQTQAPGATPADANAAQRRRRLQATPQQ